MKELNNYNNLVNTNNNGGISHNSKQKPVIQMETFAEYKLRQSLIDFTMSEIFPLQQVKLLIDVLFVEMYNAQQRLHGAMRDYSNQHQHQHYLSH